TYDGAGRTTSLTDHDGNTTRYSYDLRGRLSEILYPGAAATDRVTFTFTPAGDLDWRKDQRSIVTQYAYNDLHHLSVRNYRTGSVSGPFIRGETFAHDRSGRLKRATNALVDALFGYDGFGRPASETQSFLQGGAMSSATTYTYVIGPAGST